MNSKSELRLEERGGETVVVHPDGKCHPSNRTERMLWERIREMEAALPDWLREMSRQMRTQENRLTAHPFWQVRCKRYLPTLDGYNESHHEVCGDEGVVWRSSDPDAELVTYLLENHEDWCKQWAEDNDYLDAYDSIAEAMEDSFEPMADELPEGIRLIPVQEIEEVVTTHFTQADAEWFIKRKQHDYPPLYTYVESAYWSPQLRNLQDWIIGLTTQEAPHDDQ